MFFLIGGALQNIVWDIPDRAERLGYSQVSLVTLCLLCIEGNTIKAKSNLSAHMLKMVNKVSGLPMETHGEN